MLQSIKNFQNCLEKKILQASSTRRFQKRPTSPGIESNVKLR